MGLRERPYNAPGLFVVIESNRGSSLCFYAFSSREPVCAPDQVRAPAWFENAGASPDISHHLGTTAHLSRQFFLRFNERTLPWRREARDGAGDFQRQRIRVS